MTVYNNMCDDVTYNNIIYSRNHVIRTYHIWTKHTLFRRRGGRGVAEALNKQL